ncbi:putative PurR-regulated permease PerM [Rhizobium sp. PP-F2F-G38]|uniref:AI-2E family transporter n=1 Tax=Ferranicluibacter rubi TaxID=2715133 RepID=A0AA43ZE27_9HYPH|nr:AI-2E family transporter [Ferranicluibacter rubi]PYE33013.1 putative PurR-regulated permease PerM [Rhizobium sp. PP-WC-1G-195]PYE97062.1 putative PurR-regulated permease PerM [Rhizobium sp. PP-F2F-G38]
MSTKATVNAPLRKADLYPPHDPNTRNKLSGHVILILLGATVVLKVGQEIFVPLALSLLLTFTLAPIVSFLRRRSVPKIAAVMIAVASAFCAIALFSVVVASQVSNLAQNIPAYQRNIVVKVQTLAQAGSGDGIMKHLSGIVERVGEEIQTRAVESQEDAAAAVPTSREPMPVEIVTRSNPIQTLGNFILPLISPFATAGLVIVLVIFMLLEREDLRDRFIRLVGLNDLHRTTEALQDAGKRVGKYLLMQLVVNALYAFPITIGLWILGIPNAILWGLLTLVLRFVPYIGPVIGMILPLFLALAIAPGWSLVLWVGALFLTTELISNNVVEPWLYGSHTGLSPLAIIISAIFWSWLWGPLGLMLSTPLTVCLVVLGRYVPQFSFLDVLLGNEPVLEPHEKLYQRLLAGDPDEATANAEDYLEDEYLLDYYEKVGMPALLLGEVDRQRGVMTEAQIERFSGSVRSLVDNLSEIADEEESEEDVPTDPEASDGTDKAGDDVDLPDGTGHSLLCIGGRGDIDDAAAAMLAQLLEIQGADAASIAHSTTDLRMLKDSDTIDTVVFTFLNGNSKTHARNLVRRLKRMKPGLRVGLFVPLANGQDHPRMTLEDTNADFITLTLVETVRSALTETGPVPLMTITRKLGRPRIRLAKTA